MREYLRARGLEQKVSEDIEKLRDLSEALNAEQVTRIRAANELRLRLLNKILPDLKAIEVAGEGGGPVGLAHSIDLGRLSPQALREVLTVLENGLPPAPG